MASRGCAARPRCSARCPRSCLAEEIATPGDGPDQGRSSPSPATRSSRVPDSGPARGGAAAARVHDRHRQLRSTRPPASPHVILPGPSPLETAPLRRAALGVGVPQSRPSGPTRCSAAREGTREEWEILDPPRAAPAPAAPTTTIDVAAHRRRLVRRPVHGLRASTPTPRAVALRPRRARAHGRLVRSASAPFGDRYGEVPDGLTLDEIKAPTRTASTSARWCPRAARWSARRTGQHRPRAPTTSSPTSPASQARLDRPDERHGARQPPPPPLEEQLDAQRRRCS